jgi:hypothetical protein
MPVLLRWWNVVSMNLLNLLNLQNYKGEPNPQSEPEDSD